MTNRTAAVRYAKALFDVSLKEQVSLPEIETQLTSFVTLFTENAALSHVLLNPAVPAPRKRAAVDEITKAVKLSPILAKLLVLLAERDRLILLPDLLAAFKERLLDHQNVVRAEVTTSTPLSPDRQQNIERSLTKATGRAIRLSARVDPAIIGGLVARVGSTVFDASVTTQLQKMKQRLVDR